jgi:hypothetical protein
VSGTKLTRTQDFTAALGGTALDALMRTTSVRTEGEENFRQFWREKRPVVFTLWHGRLLPCTYHHRHQDVVTLVSHHRDGEYITRLVQKWGYTAVRGSSSRGGLDALRELVRHLRAGRSLAITPDGPRGPREKLKPGPCSPRSSPARRSSRRFGGEPRIVLRGMGPLPDPAPLCAPAHRVRRARVRAEAGGRGGAAGGGGRGGRAAGGTDAAGGGGVVTLTPGSLHSPAPSPIT